MTNNRPDMIQFRDVHKYYVDYHALRGITASIKAGEFFSLLGPSGCGKTTTLRMIGGFESPDSGRILIDDRDVTDDEPEVRPLNTVFQNYALFPHLNVFDNVAFGLRFEDPKPATEKVRERVMRARAARPRASCAGLRSAH